MFCSWKATVVYIGNLLGSSRLAVYYIFKELNNSSLV